MLPWCCNVVSMVLLGVAMAFLGGFYSIVRCYYGVARWLLWCCHGVAMWLLWCC